MCKTIKDNFVAQFLVEFLCKRKLIEMAKKVDQSTIIILDIGKNTANNDEKSKTFFENAIECTKLIIERKIMCQGKDLIGIILMGTKETKNRLAEELPSAFQHIKLFFELEVPAWKMIRELPDSPEKSRGDWFDALVVAADYFKNGFSGIKCLNKRIILMTNFESPSNVDETDFEQALNGFKEDDIQVDVIGCDIYSDMCKNQDIELVKNFVEGTNGVTAPFNETMRYLLFHKRRHVNATPWNVDLCIGPNIKIPVSSYIRIRDDPLVKGWTKAVKDPVTGSASTNEAVNQKRIYLHTENKNLVDEDKIIKGYHYGQTIIPLGIDKSLIYEPGQKSLIVYGFTQTDKLQWQNMNGDGLSYVFGRKGDKKAQHAVTCLVQCLKELNLVAIVRRVYNNGNAPKMFALMPVIDNNDYICLSMAGVCFKEEIKNMAFPQTHLKKFTCTNEQVDAFKSLIKAMDLTKAYSAEEFDDNEAFPVAETISPSAQYILDCIAFRAMNPKVPLPPPRADIMTLFNVPTFIEKNAADVVEKLKTLFILNKVEVKQKNKQTETSQKEDAVKSDVTALDQELHSDMSKIKLPLTSTTKSVKKIGTINPISDYKFLLGAGKPQNALAVEISNAIESLINSNLDVHKTKAVEALLFFRSECVNSDPSYYNVWLQNFKKDLYNQLKMDVIKLLEDKGIMYINKSENSLSIFDKDFEEESQVYEMDTAPDFTQLEVNSNINKFFDD